MALSRRLRKRATFPLKTGLSHTKTEEFEPSIFSPKRTGTTNEKGEARGGRK